MVKTSTSLNVNSVDETATEKSVESLDIQNELFLNSLKWQLDNLRKDPSDLTIQNILDYAKRK